jgi:hypothetical protein
MLEPVLACACLMQHSPVTTSAPERLAMLWHCRSARPECPAAACRLQDVAACDRVVSTVELLAGTTRLCVSLCTGTPASYTITAGYAVGHCSGKRHLGTAGPHSRSLKPWLPPAACSAQRSSAAPARRRLPGVGTGVPICRGDARTKGYRMLSCTPSAAVCASGACYRAGGVAVARTDAAADCSGLFGSPAAIVPAERGCCSQQQRR